MFSVYNVSFFFFMILLNYKQDVVTFEKKTGYPLTNEKLNKTHPSSIQYTQLVWYDQ